MTDFKACGGDYGPAAHRACPECPWLTMNADRPHPDDWYSDEALGELWDGLRDGAILACHYVEADREVYALTAEQIAAGFHEPAPSSKGRECSGAVVALLRESERALSYASYRAYRDANPRGLSADAIKRVRARATGEGVPLRAPSHLDRKAVRAPATGTPHESRERFTASEVAKMANVARALGILPTAADPLQCDCLVCVNHGTAHVQVDVETAAGTFPVDVPLASLLKAMAAAGIVSVASCQALGEALDRLDASRRDELLAAGRNLPVSHNRAIEANLAFVRFLTDTVQGRRLARRAAALNGVEVTQVPGLAQLVFAIENAAAIEALL